MPTGWVGADAVVGGASAVVTTFAGAVDVVAVAMEGGDGDDLSLGIEGAQRSADPPTVVADGPRAVAIFPVVPEKDARVVVTVATGPRRRLVGIAGSHGVTPDVFAAAVAAQGFPAVVPDALPTTTGAALVSGRSRHNAAVPGPLPAACRSSSRRCPPGRTC